MAHKLLISTRKGLALYKKSSSGFKFDTVHFMGIPVSYFYLDQHSGRWWAGLDHGHWGCKLHYSDDEGKTWQESESPKYPDGAMIKEDMPATTRLLWAMATTGNGSGKRLLVGTEPGGLFESDDNGLHFAINKSLWNHPSRETQWFGGGREHPAIHSIVVDPGDEKHIFVGISVAGVFETRDGGKSWTPKNNGLTADFLPDSHAEVGHDPHLLHYCHAFPEVMWQQNHCGIFRTADGGENWTNISEKDGPAKFGFAIQADEKNPDVAWVVPAVSDEIRVAVNSSLCICRTEDGGKSWQKFTDGLPQEATFDITLRHALAKNDRQLAFGTTTGNLYLSNDYGESWRCLNNNLPPVYAVNFI